MGNLISLVAVPRLYLGIVNEAIPVAATMMTIGADTIPACTAAWPITRAPTMLTAEPIALGRRIPASRSPSKTSSIIIASMIAGNGTPSRAPEMLIRSVVGISLG
ncbi:hypothetical protein D3C77_580950 [compost metagenome]